MPIDEINEPQPGPKKASVDAKLEITVRIVDSKTGELTAITSSKAYVNEKQLREEPKY